jgi:hypothetical protein
MTWRTPEADALIAKVLASDPDWEEVRDDVIWPPVRRRFLGAEMDRLRAIYDRTASRAIEEADRRFYAGTPWEEASVELQAILSEGEPDKLIERLLKEAHDAQRVAA